MFLSDEMTLCSTEDSKVVPGEPLGDVFKVTFGNVEDSQGNRVALGGIYYRITCRRQFSNSQSFVVSNTLNIKPGGYFYARQGYRIDVTGKLKMRRLFFFVFSIEFSTLKKS